MQIEMTVLLGCSCLCVVETLQLCTTFSGFSGPDSQQDFGEPIRHIRTRTHHAFMHWQCNVVGTVWNKFSIKAIKC